MFIIANFLMAAAKLLEIAITVYIWVVIIRALISWFNVDPYNPIVQVLRNITDPVLRRIRQFVPVTAGLDLSPIVLIFILYFAQYFFVSTLRDLANAIR